MYARSEVGGWVGGLSQKHTRAYRVGGMVKNALGVRTFWMTSSHRPTPDDLKIVCRQNKESNNLIKQCKV